MRILFLSPRQCWPLFGGAKLREYYFAAALGRQSSMTYLYYADPGAAPLTVKDLPFCERVIAVAKPRPYTAWKIAQGLTGKWPLPVVNYTSEEMTGAVGRLAREQAFDIVHLDSIHMAASIGPLMEGQGTGPRVLYNWHNIESEAMRRYAATVASPARRVYAAYTAKRMENLEREILQTGFGHIVCSERERQALRAIAPKARVEVVDNGVDTAHFGGRNKIPGRRLVFVGLMNYAPNVEAAISFVRNIWPAVLERFPDLELRIVGANPTPAVEALRSSPRVEVTGTVPDVRPYYDDALAAIVPLRTGGGTRLKILEAMAAGVPVISTPLGAEGLTLTPDGEILIAGPDDREQWLRHIAHLMNSSGAAQALSQAAFERVKTQYDWEILGDRLVRIYREWLRDEG